MEQQVVHSLPQFGTLPFQRPSAWHVLSAGPFSVYPVSHEYLATSPKEVPALVSTRPLLGSTSWPQDTPAVINQEMSPRHTLHRNFHTSISKIWYMYGIQSSLVQTWRWMKILPRIGMYVQYFIHLQAGTRELCILYASASYKTPTLKFGIAKELRSIVKGFRGCCG